MIVYMLCDYEYGPDVLVLVSFGIAQLAFYGMYLASFGMAQLAFMAWLLACLYGMVVSFDLVSVALIGGLPSQPTQAIDYEQGKAKVCCDVYVFIG